MSDMDRFTEFLLRAGAAYHAPPETPREAMWASIERGLAESDAGDAGDPLIAAAATYHEPPVAPADDMWGRIEAAWALRSGAPEGARDAGLDELAPVPWSPGAGERAPTREGRLRRWTVGFAVAASLAIGIAIGRSSMDEPGATGPQVAADDATLGAVAGTTAAANPAAEDPVSAGDTAAEPLESGLRLATDEPGTSGPPVAGETAGATPDASSPRRSSRDVAMRVATAQHMGRAETLLMAFRAGSEGEDDTAGLAQWAGRLLGETRLLLDSSDSRPDRQRALLEELELVLAQIAGLSPDAPDFERGLIADGIERQGTIARLRAASPGPGSGSLTGT